MDIVSCELYLPDLETGQSEHARLMKPANYSPFQKYLDCSVECEGWVQQHHGDPAYDLAVPGFETEPLSLNSGAEYLLEPKLVEADV